MNKNKITAILILVLMIGNLFSQKVVAAEITNSEVQTTIADSAKYLLSLFDEESPVTYQDYWTVMVIARSGISGTEQFYDTYYNSLLQALNENDGKLIETDSYTGTQSESIVSYAGAALTLAFIGKDATNVGGYNLIDKIEHFDRESIHNLYFSSLPLVLTAVEQFDSDISDKTLKSYLIDELLTHHVAGSGFGSEYYMDVDSTAMCVQALSPYYESDSKVKTALDESMEYIRNEQLEDGRFQTEYSWEGIDYQYINSDTTAMALLAAVQMGSSVVSDLNGENGTNVVDALMTFLLNDPAGAFTFTSESPSENVFATIDSLRALTNYERLMDGKSLFYNISDTPQVIYRDVIDKINALPDEIQLTDQVALNEINTLYNNLPDVFKQKISNYNSYVQAKSEYDSLVNQQISKETETTKVDTVTSDTTVEAPATGDQNQLSVLVAALMLSGVTLLLTKKRCCN